MYILSPFVEYCSRRIYFFAHLNRLQLLLSPPLPGHPYVGDEGDDEGEHEEGGHDEQPEAGQDVQGGLVDQTEDRLRHQLHRGLEEADDGEDLANLLRLHQLGHSGPGGREDVVVEVVHHDPDDEESPNLR